VTANEVLYIHLYFLVSSFPYFFLLNETFRSLAYSSVISCPELTTNFETHQLGFASIAETKPEGDGLNDEVMLRDLHRLLLETRVVEGKLVCGNCGHEYRIKEGIANFLLPSHLGMYEEEDDGPINFMAFCPLPTFIRVVRERDLMMRTENVV
jgi:uncharacterized protein YbaR (Trm112 family)